MFLRYPDIALRFIKNLSLQIAPNDLNARLKHMTSDLYSFYGANPQLFARDFCCEFSRLGAINGVPSPSGIILADFHVCNQGTGYDYDKNGKKNGIIWGVNDFDQIIVGRFDMDICRTAGSLGVIAMMNKNIGMKSDLREILTELIDSYYKEFAHLEISTGNKESCYIQNPAELGEPFAIVLDRVKNIDVHKFYGKYVDSHGDRFKKIEGRLAPLDKNLQLYDELNSVFRAWVKLNNVKDLQIDKDCLDIACRLGSGGSSLGAARYWFLARASDGKSVRIVEMKELIHVHDSSVGKALLQYTSRSSSLGQVQYNLQGTIGYDWSPYRGYAVFNGSPYMLRAREPVADGFEMDDFLKWGLNDAVKVARLSGKFLARVHARTNDTPVLWIEHDDKKNVAAKLYDFVVEYIDQLEKDMEYVRKDLKQKS